MSTEVKVSNVLSRLWKVLGGVRRRQFVWLAVLALLASVAEMLSLGAVVPFLAVLSDPGLLTGSGGLARFAAVFGVTGDRQGLLLFAIIFALSALASGAMRILLAWANTRYSVAVGAQLAKAAYASALARDYEDHVATNTAEVISAITVKANVVIFKVVLPLLVILNSMVLACALGAAIIVISPSIALVTLGSLALVYLVVFRGVRKLVAADGATIARESSHVLRVVQEGLGGIRDVLIDGTAKLHVERFADADRRLRLAQGRNAFVAVVPRYIAESVGIFAIALIATWYAVGSDGVARVVPVLGALALAAQRVLPLLQQTYAAWTSVQASKASLDDLLRFVPTLDIKHSMEVEDPSPRFTDRVEFDHVVFRYRGSDRNVVDGISLRIPKGARVGVVGKSGCGKSTLVDLLMGLLQPTSGSIRVDGVAIGPSNRQGWQRLVAHVPQSVFVADQSLAENVSISRGGDPLDEARVKRAVTVAQLGEFVAGLSGGLDAHLGERGGRISGGQRQRLGIARALYKDAKLIVFDEATSALDRETEGALVDAIGDIDRDVTVVMIAHRYETLKHCDLIVEMNDGKINWMGSYAELVAKKSAEVPEK